MLSILSSTENPDDLNTQIITYCHYIGYGNISYFLKCRLSKVSKQ